MAGTGNALILAVTSNMEKPKWLEERRRGIGASEIAAVAGISPYRSAYEVYLDKIGEMPDIARDEEKMQWGLDLEEVIAKRFSKRTGIRIFDVKYILQHPQHEWMLANLDFGCEEKGEEGILEIKTAGEMAGQNWFNDIGDVTVPDHYLLQVQHQLAVTGYPWAYIACLIGGQKLIWQKILRDEEIVNYLLNIGGRFWNENVLKKVPPAMTGLPSETDVLKRKNPDALKTEIELPLRAAEFLTQRENAVKEIKYYEQIRDAAENELRLMMGENEIGYIGDKRIKYSTVESWRIDEGKIKTEMPELFEKYKKLVSFRRFYFGKN